MKYSATILILLLLLGQVSAQKNDTLVIGPKQVNTKKVRTGTHFWINYNINSKDSIKRNLIAWQMTIEPVVHHDKSAFSIRQLVTGRDTIMMSTHTICDPETFVTRYHQSRSSFSSALDMDFENKTFSINGKPVTANDTARSSKIRWRKFDSSATFFSLNWNIDLAILPLLPYKANRTFLINFFEPGGAPTLMPYTVINSEFLYNYDNSKTECWVLQRKKPVFHANILYQ